MALSTVPTWVLDTIARHPGKATGIVAMILAIMLLSPIIDQGTATLAAVEDQHRAATLVLTVPAEWEVHASYALVDGGTTLSWPTWHQPGSYAVTRAWAQVDGAQPVPCERVELDGVTTITVPDSAGIEHVITYEISDGQTYRYVLVRPQARAP